LAGGVILFLWILRRFSDIDGISEEDRRHRDHLLSKLGPIKDQIRSIELLLTFRGVFGDRADEILEGIIAAEQVKIEKLGTYNASKLNVQDRDPPAGMFDEVKDMIRLGLPPTDTSCQGPVSQAGRQHEPERVVG
jgi:hypothetical protein